MKYIVAGDDEKEETEKSDHEEGSSKNKKRNEKWKEDKVNESKKKNEATTCDFVIDNIVDHTINKSRWHRYAKAGEGLYRVRSYGYETDEDPWEPKKELPRGKIVSYFRKKKLPIRGSIDQADDGREIQIPYLVAA